MRTSEGVDIARKHIAGFFKDVLGKIGEQLTRRIGCENNPDHLLLGGRPHHRHRITRCLKYGRVQTN